MGSCRGVTDDPGQSLNGLPQCILLVLFWNLIPKMWHEWSFPGLGAVMRQRDVANALAPWMLCPLHRHTALTTLYYSVEQKDSCETKSWDFSLNTKDRLGESSAFDGASCTSLLAISGQPVVSGHNGTLTIVFLVGLEVFNSANHGLGETNSLKRKDR